jgi:hypothetical protein
VPVPMTGNSSPLSNDMALCHDCLHQSLVEVKCCNKLERVSMGIGRLELDMRVQPALQHALLEYRLCRDWRDWRPNWISFSTQPIACLHGNKVTAFLFCPPLLPSIPSSSSIPWKRTLTELDTEVMNDRSKQRPRSLVRKTEMIQVVQNFLELQILTTW